LKLHDPKMSQRFEYFLRVSNGMECNVPPQCYYSS
jgi:hypothetical protein